MLISIPYGHSHIDLQLPDAADMITYSAGRGRPPLSDEELAKALERPIASRPLRELAAGKRSAVIAVSDQTRLIPSARIVPPLLDELNRGGIPDGRIRVLVALGAHRKLTEDERRELVGERVWRRVEVLNHSIAPEDNVALGTTRLGTPVALDRRWVDAELRIVTGNIEPHRLVGVSGGVKAVVPGCASKATIEANHGLSHRFKAELGHPGNPIHDDLAEAAAMAPPHFLYNAVVDHRRNVLGAYCGDVRAAHAQGLELVRATFFVPVRRKYDLIVFGCGGAPKDAQLYQAVKSMQNAAAFARPNGTLLALAECPEHFGNGSLQAWIETGKDRASMIASLRERFELGPHKLEHLDRLLRSHRIALFSSIPAPLAELTGFEAIDDPQEWLSRWLSANPNASVAVMPAAAVTFPLQDDTQRS